MFRSPKGGFSLLVHPPDVVVLGGEEDEAMQVRLEERLRSKSAFNFGILVVRDLSIWRRRSLHGLSRGLGARSVVTELSPVIAVVANS